MAQRPIFIPRPEGHRLVETRMVEFDWYPGMAVSQKQKSIASLHAAAVDMLGIQAVLEISTKSTSQLGVALSAFNLSYEPKGSKKQFSVETLFQSSKVFSGGGPYRDIRDMSPGEAKKDPRLKSSGNLLGFKSAGVAWPLEPKTAFYDWLYLNVLVSHPELARQLLDYDGFTDIEFNPGKSINCQAYSAALYVALHKRGLLADALSDKDAFLALLHKFDAGETGSDTSFGGSLFH